jgi:prevent-host-death family protein
MGNMNYNPLKVSLDNIIPLTEARDHFSQIVNEVQKDKLYVLTKGGKPAVAIIDVKYLEGITGGEVRESIIEEEIKKDPNKVGRTEMLPHDTKLSVPPPMPPEPKPFEPPKIVETPKPTEPTKPIEPPKPMEPPKPIEPPKPVTPPPPPPASKPMTPPTPAPDEKKDEPMIETSFSNNNPFGDTNNKSVQDSGQLKTPPIENSVNKETSIPIKSNTGNTPVPPASPVPKISITENNNPSLNSDHTSPDDKPNPAQFSGNQNQATPEPDDMVID